MTTSCLRLVGLSLLVVLAGCGGGSSTSDPTSSNTAPIANAGPAQSVTTGTSVNLDGSASFDANNDALTYAWTLTSRPVGSGSGLSSSTSAKPAVLVDVAGSYVATLVVNDGKVNSSPVTVTITATLGNVAPIANAGLAQSVVAGTVVGLDASASSDTNNDSLTYAWTLTSKPLGSGAGLSSATSVKPNFTADIAGTYVATLIVNDGKLDSTATAVSIVAAVANVAPVANSGAAQSLVVGSVVTLDGSASSDANGDPLFYLWALTTKPIGSLAVLSSSTAIRPTFTADLAGSYVATLIVNDGKLSSSPSRVAVSAATANVAPVANAGLSQSVNAGTLVSLNGGSSSDANSDPLTYSWVLTGKPVGSIAVLSGAASALPTFTPDIAGTYVATLIVNDGKVNSTQSTTTVTAATPVGGLLTTSVRWTVANSPYVLTSNVLVPAGVTLAIDPGVRVVGAGMQVQVAGTFSVEGTTSNLATLENLLVWRASSVGSPPYQISIVGASVVGGSVCPPTGGAWGPGSFVLTDSRLNGVGYLYLYYPTGTNKVERNVFTNSGGISFGIGSNNIGDGMAGTLSVTNNAFIGWTGGFAVQNWATYASGSSSVRLNSFLSTDRFAVSLPDGYTSVSLDAASNYWGTVDVNVVQSMIYDRTKSLLSGGTINYTPTLTAPDAATPN